MGASPPLRAPHSSRMSEGAVVRSLFDFSVCNMIELKYCEERPCLGAHTSVSFTLSEVRAE